MHVVRKTLGILGREELLIAAAEGFGIQGQRVAFLVLEAEAVHVRYIIPGNRVSKDAHVALTVADVAAVKDPVVGQPLVVDVRDRAVRYGDIDVVSFVRRADFGQEGLIVIRVA